MVASLGRRLGGRPHAATEAAPRPPSADAGATSARGEGDGACERRGTALEPVRRPGHDRACCGSPLRGDSGSAPAPARPPRGEHARCRPPWSSRRGCRGWTSRQSRAGPAHSERSCPSHAARTPLPFVPEVRAATAISGPALILNGTRHEHAERIGASAIRPASPPAATPGRWGVSARASTALPELTESGRTSPRAWLRSTPPSSSRRRSSVPGVAAGLVQGAEC